MRMSVRDGRMLFMLLVLQLSTSAAKAQLTVRTEIYPGVELLNVIHLLSDSAETIPSTYATDVRKYFHAFKDHPAVMKARQLALINCDFPVRHAWCFYNFPDIRLRLPDTLGAYNKYETTAAIQDYFKACVDFYRESKFMKFFNGYRSEYENWTRSFNRNLYEDGMIGRMENFYRIKPAGKVTFTLGAMNCNSFSLPETGDINPAFEGTSTIFVAFGNLRRSTDSTRPYFYSAFNSQLIWHETGHVFLAGLFRKYASEVDSLRDIFEQSEEMRQEAGRLSWALFLDENITQAVTSYLRIYTDIVTREAEQKRLSSYYYLAKIMIGIIEEQYGDGKEYNNFDEFFPVLLDQLGKKLRSK